MFKVKLWGPKHLGKDRLALLRKSAGKLRLEQMYGKERASEQHLFGPFHFCISFQHQLPPPSKVALSVPVGKLKGFRSWVLPSERAVFLL